MIAGQISEQTQFPPEYEISMDPPSFTTPTLDFESHSSLLSGLVKKLYDYKQTYFNQVSELIPLQDISKVIKERELKICSLRDKTLMKLCQFTLPKRKQLKKSTNQPQSEAAKEALLDFTFDFDPTLSSQQKSFYHYLRAKILNIEGSSFSDRVFCDLQKSYKLNSNLVEVWNELGDYYYSNNMLSKAILHFDRNLKFKTDASNAEFWSNKDKRSLFNLSIAIRNKPQVQYEDLKMSLEMAKVALKRAINELALDRDSKEKENAVGEYYYGVGLAKLAIYFNASHDFADIFSALKFFDIAEKNYIHKDLYFNRSIIHLYLGNYQNAVNDYERNAQLDPLLTECNMIKIQEIINYFEGMCAQIAKSSLTAYKKVFCSVPDVFRKYNVCGFKDLDLDKPNPEKLLKVKVVAQVEHHIAKAFVVDDGEEGINALIVYNISNTVVQPNSTFLIAEPIFKKVCLTYKQKLYSFNAVCVNDLKFILINGQAIKGNDVEYASITVTSSPY